MKEKNIFNLTLLANICINLETSKIILIIIKFFFTNKNNKKRFNQKRLSNSLIQSV